MKKRLEEINRYSVGYWKCLFYIEVDNIETVEKYLHNKFDDYRVSK